MNTELALKSFNLPWEEQTRTASLQLATLGEFFGYYGPFMGMRNFLLDPHHHATEKSREAKGR